MSTPSNLPSQVGAPGGAPTDVLSIALFLSQFVQSVNMWVSRAANAVNWLLGQSTGRAHTSISTLTSLAFSTTSTTPVSTGFSATITPKYSGIVLCLAQTQASNATAGDVNWVNIWYGTGTAPAVNATMSGTALNGAIAGQSTSFVLSGNLSVPIVGATLLQVGTPYWFTLGSWVTAGTGVIDLASMTLVEI